MRHLAILAVLAACGVQAGEELSIAPSAATIEHAPPEPAVAPETDLRISQAPEAAKVCAEREKLDALDLFRRAVAGGEAAERSWRALPEAVRVHALARSMEGGAEGLRRRALAELQAADLTGLDDEAARTAARHALARAAVREPVDEVREGAREAWAEQARLDGKPALEEMAGALDRPNAMEQRRAFQALQAAGGLGVAEVLITRIERRWGAGARNHILVATQRSYIADYDVSGAVFDPVIKSFMTGVVLDSRVLGIEITEYIVELLRGAGAGPDVLRDPRRWAGFIEEARAKQAAGR